MSDLQKIIVQARQATESRPMPEAQFVAALQKRRTQSRKHYATTLALATVLVGFSAWAVATERFVPAPGPVMTAQTSPAPSPAAIPNVTAPRVAEKHAAKQPVSPSADSLWMVADSARAHGDWEAAAKTLQRVHTLYPRDPRRSLAAFTLGRLHSEHMGAPALAARWFQQVCTDDPNIVLCQQATLRAKLLLRSQVFSK